MIFVFHSKILHKHCLQFLLGAKMAPRETDNNAYAKFGLTNKEHYGMLWYFLEWSIRATKTLACFATLLQNELKRKVARFTTSSIQTSGNKSSCSESCLIVGI